MELSPKGGIVATGILLAVLACSDPGGSVERGGDAPAEDPASGPRTAAEEPGDPESWPLTCEVAARDIVDRLDGPTQRLLRDTPRDELIQFHHSLGRAIRNHHGLWAGNDALIRSCLGGPGHPDDASVRIIQRAWEILQ